MGKRLGGNAIRYENPPSISYSAACVGRKEGDGPLKDYYDEVCQDTKQGEKTWEKAESHFQKHTIDTLLKKANASPKDIQFLFGGDLLNQCISTAYGVRDFNIPFYGLYGACSTMAEGMVLSAMMVDGDFADKCIAITSSHYCSAERQYRFPLVYGGQRTPTAQWTVTGSGAMLIEKEGNGPYIVGSYTGKIVDMGITDANNMGAAMAPAAIDTISGYLKDTNTKPSDYDLIVTGDLGQVGFDVVNELMAKDGLDLQGRYNDCGLLVYDRERQDVHAGGSGCGCSAVVMCSYVMNQMRAGKLKNVLFIGTGALMSTVAVQQGQSVMGIGHLVHISTSK